jgi:ribonuclease P protein component
MKESWKSIHQELPQGYDFIIIARNSINEKKYSQIHYSMSSALRRAGLLKKAR